MRIPTLRTQPQQCLFQIKQILLILAARPPALENMRREHLRVLRAKELRVGRQPDVDQAFDRFRVRSRVEGRELYAVPVDLTDVKVLPDLGDAGGGDVVCGAPDALCGLVLAWC